MPIEGKPDMCVVAATEHDLATVSSILTEAGEWLRRNGKGMWRPDETAPEAIASQVRDGLFFLALVDGAPLGALRFQLSDPKCWPDLDGDDSAFVHRLAVRRAAAGTGLSAAMLAWAAARARSLGRDFLRLDCDPGRAALVALYERCGFRLHSVVTLGPEAVHGLGCDMPAHGDFLLARYELDLLSTDESRLRSG